MTIRKRGNPKEQAKAFLKAATFGEYITKLRDEKDQSLAYVGKKIDVSSNYLSEIERGLKSPSDEVLRAIAKYFNIPEEEIFERIGRVPLQAREELEEYEQLQRLLLKVRNSNFSDEKKKELYDQIDRIYEEMAEENNEGGV